ncbi:outer membrane protein assembly factor BamA [Aestuariivirga litoralis]|uniref:outer membrane protein assembly factor BamA n=1 Tax=Aestuariivirga litoralis TaxID=2650924 RepID=UPI0018C7DBA6|nr:outer membrane protein assembly factor BamA [Aestuariivirga litoralis]MBG1231727.1 outer membrane protein assembly factor BamA [Aestuariivirga litoralis]
MRKNFRLVGMFVLALLLAVPMFGAVSLIPTAAYAVQNGVVIEGNQRVERATVLQYLQFGPNEAVTPEKVDASIKALFQTGLFADVKIDRRGSNIVIHVVENPMINKVNFEGNSEIDDTSLQKEVEVHQNMIFTKSRIQSDTRRVLALYQSKGFYNVRVDPKLIDLSDNRVNVAFEISENGKTQIDEIVFVGNKSLSADRLRGEMVTKQKAWWNPFGNNTTYDPDKLEYDKELVRRFYLKNGFADIQVLSAEAHQKPDGRGFLITITVEEGPRYDIKDVAVNVGTANLNGDELRKKVRTGVGDTYDASKVDKSVEALTLEASNQGFTFAKVDPKVDRNPDGRSVNITYNLTEGNRAYVERIDIVGNSRTRDYVIRRELQLYEGDAYNPTLIERARRRLTALNYFDKVDFQQQPGSSPDKVVLIVDVQEKSTGSLTFSVGYSSTETVVGSIEYAERNMFGMGIQQSVATSASFVKQSINYSITDPYFLGSNISAGLDIFANNTDNQVSSSYNSTQYGGALRTGFKLDEYQSMNFKYLLAYRSIYNVNTSIATPLAISEQGSTWKNAISVGYVYDAVDNPNLPTSGLRAMLTSELAGLGDAQYGKVEGKAWYFLPLFEDQVVVKFQGTAGHIQSLGNSVNLQDRFFKGGDSFRGFSPGGVGPQQIGNNGNWQAIGAQDYAIGTVEASFPLGLPQALGISGAIFTDFGTVFNGGDVVTNGCTFGGGTGCSQYDGADFRLSVGAGLVWSSPFGPLRLDWSYPLLKAEHDSVQYWRFSLGTRF